jgi:hypothetical protein
MGSTRRSKRLAGGEPSAEKSTKRRRRPNTSTIAAFDNQQHTLTKRTKGKRKAKPSRTPEVLKSLFPTPLKAKQTLINITSSPPNIPFISLSRPPRNKRATTPPPSSPFNLTNKGKVPYNVTLIITLVINKIIKENDGICINLDINDVFRKTLDDLHCRGTKGEYSASRLRWVSHVLK